MSPIPIPLRGSKFSLDISGVGGFFGGDEAVSAMATVHLLKGRRWLGWYNSPGSYTVAKRFGQIAVSYLWDGLFPGPNETPAVSFGLDGRSGPMYIAPFSGTVLQTGHLGYLTMLKAKQEIVLHDFGWRNTSPHDVALLELQDVDYNRQVPQRATNTALLGLIPMLASIAACIACGLVADWYCFSMILLGIISSGVTCLVIGPGELFLETVKTPASGAPPGDGILLGDDTMIIVKGAEKNVNAITKGKFRLKISGEPTYHNIGFCALLLLVQFLSQLLLIPQGTLFGQILFLSTFAISWVYNSYLACLEKEMIQATALFKMLGNPNMQKFRPRTRTTMAVFACLLICNQTVGDPHIDNIRGKVLQNFIPNDTLVWQRWRDKVIRQMKGGTSCRQLEYLKVGEEESNGFNEDDLRLLSTLLDDAKSAFRNYDRYIASS